MWLVDEKAQQLCSTSTDKAFTHMSTLGLFSSFAMVVLVELSVR